MSANSAPPRDITIAWATQVSLAQLGARVAAYVQTRATITTFRLVTRDTSLTACHNLPEEIKSMIASAVRDIVFKRGMEIWAKISKCLDNTCTTLSHVNHALFNALDKSRFSSGSERRSVKKFFAEVAAKAHQQDVIRHCRYLTDLNGTSKLAKCVQIFAQDFGVHPYFMIQKFYASSESFDVDIEHVEAKAYLTLPLVHVPMSSNPGLRAASFSINSILNPSVLMGPTEAQLRQFTDAANILNLHRYDPDEDETVFQYRRKTYQFPSWLGDIDSISSEDGHKNVDGAESEAMKSDEGEKSGVASEPTKEHTEEDLDVDAKSAEEGATWPQLMILGCGELEARDHHRSHFYR